MEDLKKIQEFFSKPLEENVDKKYNDFLIDLRDSGVTNMFGAAPYLQAEFGLDKREAREILANWMRSFGESLQEISKEDAWKEFQLKRHVTDKTAVAAKKDFDKGWDEGKFRDGIYKSVNEAQFTDYSNNELAAYARELSKQRADAASKGQSDLVSGINKEIEAATRELKKRSQALKNLSRTDVNERKYNPDQEQLDDEDEIFLPVDDEGIPLEEAYVPSNIAEFAQRKGISSLVRKVAGWAEKVGARITGGTAIGKGYNTLILDLGYQTADIRIDVEDETIELYDEPVNSFPEFKRVFMEEESRKQAEHDEEQLRRERGLEEEADHSSVVKTAMNEAFGEQYYLRVRLKDAPEAMKAFDDFIGKNDFRINKGGDQFSTDDVKAGIRLYRHLTDRLVKVFDHNLPLEDKHLPVYEANKENKIPGANYLVPSKSELDSWSTDKVYTYLGLLADKAYKAQTQNKEQTLDSLLQASKAISSYFKIKESVLEGINDFSPLSYAKKIASGKMSIEDAMKETGFPFTKLAAMAKEINPDYKASFTEADLEEAMGGQLDERYFIEVSVRDARKALDIYADEYRNTDIETYGSNVYASNDFGDIYDLYMSLMANGIEILDSSNFDEDPYDYEDMDDELLEADMPYNKKRDLIKRIISKAEALQKSISLDRKADQVAKSIKIDVGNSSSDDGTEKGGKPLYRVLGGTKANVDEAEGYSKFLKDDPEHPGGKTKGLTPDVMNKILMKIVQDIDETKQLGEGVIEEELCPKGKAYIKKRMAAGEKSSAYLSGRAVKVCKGQMKG